jgi:glycosyltransferase involved in cell wall biosynthesis
MLAMIHGNLTRVENGKFLVDRKFHTGMQMYLKSVDMPIISIHPEAAPGQGGMDLVEIPVEELGYRVITAKVDNRRRLLPGELEKIEKQLAGCRLLYGHGLRLGELAKRLKVPFILVLEYDLSTHIMIARTASPSFARGIARSVKEAFRYWSEIPDFMNAAEIHCNGYPIYEATRRYNKNRMMYLDSRMGSDELISAEELEARLASLQRKDRPVRLLFTGRYEAIKGVEDLIRVARACLERGADIEFHTYGQGSLGGRMKELAAGHSRIFIHDAVPYPELVKISRGFDLFVCCHIQCDPSCTYLESLGAGLPIAGYDNLMWKGLRGESKTGPGVPIGDVKALADRVIQLIHDPAQLASLARTARTFAQAHVFEREYQRRTDAIARLAASA